MSSQAGWYPDPGGQPGMYRYWDGNAWTTSLTHDPLTQDALPGQPAFGAPDYQPGQNYQPAPRRKRHVGAWLLLGVAVVVIALVAGLLVRQVSLGGSQAGSNATPNLCPTVTPGATATPVERPADGRVHGGMLSYPGLPSPWSGPMPDHRVPFGTDVNEQVIVVEQNFQEDSDWVASVLVANLVAGDGFFSPQAASEIVVKCVVGTFYGDAEVAREDRANKATTVDGRPAWLVETHLTFDIPGLQTKGETAIIVIVATSDNSSSLFYASIPDTTPQYLNDARAAQAGLRVGA